MKPIKYILTVILLLGILACGSDTEMDQNLEDPRNTPGQNTVQDSDEDGIEDAADQCPDTPSGTTVDEKGCADSQKDSDGDGVSDAEDNCPDTLEYEPVDEQGCAESQKDTDGDRIFDINDECPETAQGEETDDNGCADSQKDTDGDGVTDDLDICAETAEGEEVNEQGCSNSQKTTYIPDDGFEENLIKLGYDDKLDDYVLTSNIEEIRNLHLIGPGLPNEPEYQTEVKDLTGIQDFSSLRRLKLNHCNLEELNIHQLPDLKQLRLKNTRIQNPYTFENNISLELIQFEGLCDLPQSVRNNELLSDLYIKGGMETEDLVISENPQLQHLTSSNITTRSLRVSNNPNLTSLSTRNSDHGYLEISNNPNLYSTGISGNVDDLNFTNCPKVTRLSVSSAEYTGPVGRIDFDSIDLSGFPLLDFLYIINITISSLDVSQNKYLNTMILDQLDLKCVKVNQQQLDAIPIDWHVDFEVEYSLECD